MSDAGLMVRYEDLSSDIQKQVSLFHEKNATPGATLDDSANSWFDLEFEAWLSARFADVMNSRKHYRLDVELPVRIADVLVESEDDDESLLDGTTINISRGGLFFKSARPIDNSSILKVIVDMSKVDPVFPKIEAIAMVVRCTQLAEGGYGIGLMFSTIYQDAKETLNLFIFKSLSYYLTHS